MAKIVFLNEYRYLCLDVNIIKVKKTVKKLILVLLMAVAVCLSGCKPIEKVKQIRVTSVQVEEIVPSSMRSMKVALAVGIDNPSIHVALSDISGALKLSGKVLGRVALDPFDLQGKSAETYHLKADLSIEKGVGLSEILGLLDMETLNKCTLDVSVRATIKGGISKVFSINDIPVNKLLDKALNEKV